MYLKGKHFVENWHLDFTRSVLASSSALLSFRTFNRAHKKLYTCTSISVIFVLVLRTNTRFRCGMSVRQSEFYITIPNYEL